MLHGYHSTLSSKPLSAPFWMNEESLGGSSQFSITLQMPPRVILSKQKSQLVTFLLKTLQRHLVYPKTQHSYHGLQASSYLDPNTCPPSLLLVSPYPLSGLLGFSFSVSLYPHVIFSIGNFLATSSTFETSPQLVVYHHLHYI